MDAETRNALTQIQSETSRALSSLQKEVLNAIGDLKGDIGGIKAGQSSALAYTKSVSLKHEACEREFQAHRRDQARHVSEELHATPGKLDAHMDDTEAHGVKATRQVGMTMSAWINVACALFIAALTFIQVREAKLNVQATQPSAPAAAAPARSGRH
ncbi:MAG: hypothetical protein NTY77_05720 [Elusimicrobia bacterium]|nr:hypothetical protein [Elusimicrobiota bacterium]